MSLNKRVNKGRGRGVLALSSYEPCPRPSKNIISHTNEQLLKTDSKKPVNIVKPLEVDIAQNISNEGEHTDYHYCWTYIL